AAHPDSRVSATGRRVREADECARCNRAGAGDMDGAAVSGGRRDKFQHRLGRIVDEDELVRCVRIQWPSAWLPADGSFENRLEDLMHDARTVEIRITREDKPHSPVAMGLEEHLLDAQPQPSIPSVRLLR